MFDEKTISAIKAYVYMLIDPRTERPFYVGKGNGNRVFQHLRLALENEDAASLKFDTIREIYAAGHTPEQVIVRHGLPDNNAFDVECALIDTLNHLKYSLSNKVAGHNAVECGLMTVDAIKARYNARPLQALETGFVVININKSYDRTAGADAILKATKEIWRMKDPRSKIKYVLSEYRGLIVEVFEVERWYTKKRDFGSGSKREGRSYPGWGFDGHIAADEIRNRYIYMAIEKKRGAANVIRYSV